MPEYTIDELAHAAGSNVRNVRAYQAKNLLPAPQRVGRANVYTDVHLARLKVIQKLLDRGYALRHISDMMQAVEQGKSVSALMGLESALTSPLASEMPTYLTEAELLDRFGPDLDPMIIEQAVKLGLLQLDGDRYMAPSPGLLSVGAELVRVGIPMSTILIQLSQLRADVERIADRFVKLVSDEVFDQYGDEIPPSEDLHRLTDFVQRVRPMAQTVVDIELRRALDNSIHTELGHRLARVAGATNRKKSKRRTAGRRRKK